jgi:RHS repeat-associated protein
MGESFSAQLSTGIATFTVPIALPAARGSAQPSLALSYSSAGGQSPAGLGWSIAIPFIARQTDRGIPKYADPAAGKPWHPEQDRFVFNGGQELVPICQVSETVATEGPACDGKLADERMPDWAPKWRYFRARVEGSFQRFFWSPDHRTWRIQDKSGVTMELGVALDGLDDPQALETDPADERRIYRWNLSREYDAHVEATAPVSGASPRPLNVVAFRYVTIDGESYLSDIYDTPPAANAAAAEVSQYAHHTHLAYESRPDTTFSFRRGWKTSASRRLVRIDVASKTFDGSTTEARHLVRRYHLEYDPDFHASFLKSLQVEGRCSKNETEAPAEGTGEIVAATSCDRLPAMTFDYQHVRPFDTSGKPSDRDLAGFEGFDERIHAMTSSPDHSVDEELTDLVDVNADGLPDVLVTAPGLFSGKHGVFYNGSGGTPDKFGLQTIGVNGVLGANAGTITLKNPNVAPLDLDGDGIVDLLHMPAVKKYAVYSSRGGNWEGRVITTASGQNAKIDFGRDALDLKVVDVNSDGLVDVVLSAGLEFETFFALGRYPGGDGQFGQAVRTSATTADISNDPVRTCVPWEGTPVRFSDPDIKLGDMNGDGLPDIVRIRRGAIRYWPGRGNGFWGTGELDDCPALSFGAGRDILMANSPQYSDIEGHSLRLDDVNGDGLDDLVQVRFDAVDVWLNVDGGGWTPNRHVIQATPASPSFADRVRLVDVNGSGTRDILWGDASAYKYIDLAGGQRPGVLTRVANGLGKTTEIEYTTAAALMLKAEAEGKPWSSKAPMASHVVSRMTINDNLDIVGMRGGKYVTEYSYRDPVYDGRQREFRGFRSATSKAIGDDNSPTSLTTSTFLLGECKDEDTSDNVDPCSVENRWRDNVREALKGLPLTSEVYDESNVYPTSQHTTYRLRRLYVGLDGREVRHAFSVATDKYVYDTSPFVKAGSSDAATVVDVQRELSPNTVEPDVTSSFALRSASAHRAHMHTGEKVATAPGGTGNDSLVDYFGNVILQIADGCVEGCGPLGADETIVVHTVPGRPQGDSGGWLFRPVEAFITGSRTTGTRKHKTMTYTSSGDHLETTAELSGTLLVDRAPLPDGTRSPAPPGASGGVDTPVTILVRHEDRDAFGNVQKESGPNGQCRSLGHEERYAQMVTSETILAGQVLAGETCGDVPLATGATYDRGLSVATEVSNIHGEPARVAYDAFGRTIEITRANPYGHEGEEATLSSIPSVKMEYFLPGNPTTQPFSLVHTMTQDGADHDVTAYQESWAYVDGLTRTLVTLSEADPTAGDAGAFVASGLVDYDAKGLAQRTYLPFFHGGTPTQFPLAITPSSPYSRQRYDAFGRHLETFGLDGSITLRTLYHQLSHDVWDAADLEPGPHNGTPATVASDGHGRTTFVSERIRVGGSLEERRTTSEYLPTGEIFRITRRRLNTAMGDPDVVRWSRYDSLGRLVLNAEPNTAKNFHADPSAELGNMRAWRYAYDDAGDLVGTSDARGCGVNYGYDSAQRLLFEDYWPCTGDQAPYTAPNLTAETGVEVLYHYDNIVTGGGDPSAAEAPPDADFPVVSSLYLGRLAWVADRGSRTLTRYDHRGRVTGVARRMAGPGQSASAIADRYAPRWYIRKVDFDGADRPIHESSGAAVSGLLGAAVPDLHEGHDPASSVSANKSVLTTEYSSRGTVKRVAGSYGELVGRVNRSADGLVTDVQYGDLAGTTTHFSFDNRRRLSSVQTFRGPPAAWTSPPSSYQPGPLYGASSPTTFQLLLQDEDFAYDSANDPTEIRDWRISDEWPGGAKPVTRRLQYDDLYRIVQVDYEFEGGSDTWTSPFASEDGGNSDPRRAPPSPHVSFPKRLLRQTFAYDWLGNTSKTTDDAGGFYDRSLGIVTNNVAQGKPYQIVGASNEAVAPTSQRRGNLAVAYDDAGNLTRMVVVRRGPCLPMGAKCSQYFAYQWDEIGRLVDARRSDLEVTDAVQLAAQLTNASAPPGSDAAVHLRYGYDANDARVSKVSGEDSDADGELSTLYPFGTLEIRRAKYTNGDYERTASSEVPYLIAHGVRLGRVVFESEQVPVLQPGATHVFLELRDQLGSCAIVLDRATSELVEENTFQAYGNTESDYRPERWKGFREDYRFSGKEEDVEVGLQYFGKRFLAPSLNRWMSPDPLGIHAPGGADLNLFAYVKGSPLKLVDPFGLADKPNMDTIANGMRLMERALWDEAEAHGFDRASTAALMNYYNERQFARGDFLPTYQDFLHNVTVRVAAAEANYRNGNYIVGSAHGFMAVVLGMSSWMYGETPGKTARNIAVGLAFGAGMRKFTGWAAGTKPQYVPLVTRDAPPVAAPPEVAPTPQAQPRAPAPGEPNPYQNLRPYEKGVVAEDWSADRAAQVPGQTIAGKNVDLTFNIRGRQVTINADNLVRDAQGHIVLESKFSPDATFTPNQQTVYPELIRAGDAGLTATVGARTGGSGLPPGTQINVRIQIDVFTGKGPTVHGQ